MAVSVINVLGHTCPHKNSESHIDASHSRQPLVKGERLVRYEVNAVMGVFQAPGASAFLRLSLWWLLSRRRRFATSVFLGLERFAEVFGTSPSQTYKFELDGET